MKGLTHADYLQNTIRHGITWAVAGARDSLKAPPEYTVFPFHVNAIDKIAPSLHYTQRYCSVCRTSLEGRWHLKSWTLEDEGHEKVSFTNVVLTNIDELSLKR